MFSSFDTLNDILSAPGMRKWFHFLYAEDQLDWFPKELRDRYGLLLSEGRRHGAVTCRGLRSR